VAKLIVVLCLLLCSLSTVAQSNSAPTATTAEAAEPINSGFELLADLPTKNQIPFFDNRFRVDENVDEITMLLFRVRGSASVVLVRPDGSKIYFRTAEQHNVRWHDDSSYDLIQIKNPMPGPWQAIGRLLPESRIMLLTDIQLAVDPLPHDLMVGETVKVTARLTNGGEPINAKDFRDVLSLDVILVSTNNADYDNFGRGVVQVASFRDDGKGYDERARDGVFTGEFQLRFVAGEWIPKYMVRTPLYTREVEQLPIMLKAAPIVADITASPVPEDGDPNVQAMPHQVVFRIDDDSVNKSSLLLQGRVRYPSGEVEEFALNEPGITPRQLQLHNRGHGSYILEVSAFGAMQNGREFMLNLPEISFVVHRPVVKAKVLEELPQNIQDEIAAEQTEPEPDFPWGLVIVVNILILGGGGVAIWLVMADKKLTDLMFWRKKAAVAMAGKPAAKNSIKTGKNGGGAQKSDDMDDILDLTLPDD
jgi:uncharacterized protein (TIGR03503 family)